MPAPPQVCPIGQKPQSSWPPQPSPTRRSIGSWPSGCRCSWCSCVLPQTLGMPAAPQAAAGRTRAAIDRTAAAVADGAAILAVGERAAVGVQTPASVARAADVGDAAAAAAETVACNRRSRAVARSRRQSCRSIVPPSWRQVRGAQPSPVGGWQMLPIHSCPAGQAGQIWTPPQPSPMHAAVVTRRSSST